LRKRCEERDWGNWGICDERSFWCEERSI